MVSQVDVRSETAAEPLSIGATVIELDALLHDYLLGLVVIAGSSGDTGSRPVQWVHSSDLADPSPFLTPRTVLLTTGTQFGDALETAEASDYVERLVHVGVTALGVAVGVQWDRIPPALIEACDRSQLPLFRVPYDTPFIAVVRTAARLLEAEAHAAEQRLGARTDSGLLGRRQHLAAAEAALRVAVLRLLAEGHREFAERIAEPLLPRLPREQLAVIRFDSPLPAQAVVELSPMMLSSEGVFSAQHDTHFTIIAEQREVAALRRALTRHGVAAGFSERATMSDLPDLLAQAERAAELARMGEDPGPLDYRPAMHAGVLQLLQQSPEAIRRARGLLAPVRQHDERHRDDLERNLAVWLAHHGQTSAAAAELGVHRHTLRARVQTIASLLQRDLDQPDTRAELWAAMRLAGQAPGGSSVGTGAATSGSANGSQPRGS